MEFTIAFHVCFIPFPDLLNAFYGKLPISCEYALEELPKAVYNIF